MFAVLTFITFFNDMSVDKDSSAKLPPVELVLAEKNSKDYPLTKGYALFLSENGKLRDKNGKQATDEALPSLLEIDSDGDNEKTHFVHLVVPNEMETPVAALSDAILRIRKKADPKKKTILIVHLKGLASN
jgi:hypothetical protein